MTDKSRRKTLSAQQARAVLYEYPDADLSAFDVVNAAGRRVNVELLAHTATSDACAAIERRFQRSRKKPR